MDADEEIAIGALIERARRRRGLSQSRLAKAAGVSQGRMSDLENDKGLPTIAQLVAIARATGASADELLGLPAPATASAEEAHILTVVREIGLEVAKDRLYQRVRPARNLFGPGEQPVTPETPAKPKKRRQG